MSPELTKLKSRLATIAVIFLAYCLLFSFANFSIAKGWLWSIWNLFLAFLPLIFSSLIIFFARTKHPHHKFSIILLAIFWLLFLPNSFYFLTDLMWLATFPAAPHFQPSDFVTISPWLTVTLLALAEFLALFAGLVSLSDIHRLLAKKLSLAKTWLILIAIFSLCGFAIYLGRFLRLNSWDIILPWRIFAQLLANFDLFALQFSMLLAAAVALIYFAFYLFRHKFRD